VKQFFPFAKSPNLAVLSRLLQKPVQGNSGFAQLLTRPELRLWQVFSVDQENLVRSERRGVPCVAGRAPHPGR
jgi:hypothetical protein